MFPSGHALGTAAVAHTAAWVAVREELLPATAVPLVVAVPVLSSVARLLEDKHWITDVIGGHLAAVAIASVALCAYETHSC